jgi:hypothetical protein
MSTECVFIGATDNLFPLCPCGSAVWEVETVVETMRTAHDPAGLTHFRLSPPLPELIRYKRREAPRDECMGEFQHTLRVGLSREFWRMGAVNGCCCEEVGPSPDGKQP